MKRTPLPTVYLLTRLFIAVTCLCGIMLAGGPTVADGNPSGRFRVAAVQCYLRFYNTAEEFSTEMTRLVEKAMATSPQLIVFPEHIGTPLVAMGHVRDPQDAPAIELAMLSILDAEQEKVQAIVAQHQVSAMRALLMSREAEMREAYLGTFSNLAKKHEVYIMTGSTSLPEPEDSTQVSNVAYIINPEGEVVGFQRKVHLLDTEGQGGLDLVPGTLEELKVFETPFGKLGIAICLDCFHVDVVNRLVELGAEFLIDPAANPKLFTENEQKTNLTSLYSRVREVNRPGVQCFAVGDLAGMPFRGKTWVLSPPAVVNGETSIDAMAQSDDREEIISAVVTLVR